MDKKPAYEEFVRRIYESQKIDIELQKAIQHHQSGQLQMAEVGCRRILEISPNHSDALHLLGLISHELGDNVKAVSLIKRAIEKDPGNPIYFNNLGTASKEQGDLDDAISCYRKAIELKADFAEAYNNLGIVLEEQGRLNEAIEASGTALTLKPDYAPAHTCLAKVLYEQGQIELAIHHYREVVRLNPESVEAYNNLATTLEKLNRLGDAREAVAAALQLEPKSYEANLNQATLEYRSGNYEAARRILAKLLREDPSHKFFAETSSLLGLVYDKLGDFNAAFGAFLEANRCVLNSHDADFFSHESVRQLAFITRLRKWFTSEKIAVWATDLPVDGLSVPVFLGGFPRSGTTLLEQILNAHSKVTTIEERPTLTKITNDFVNEENSLDSLTSLSRKVIAAYRSDYWARVYPVEDSTEKRGMIVDKLPLNIIWLGLIYRFFPEAKVIVALRDPRDVTISSFMQNFRLNRSMYHFLTLEGTAKFYAVVMDLYLHYRRILPLDFIEVRYEDLVFNTESEMRRLIDFLGLAWEDKVLRYYLTAKQRKITTPSYKQVIKPIYQESIARWINYRRWLEPVLPHLNRFVKALGYNE
jgi:Flp pilus assembly protein TadD